MIQVGVESIKETELNIPPHIKSKSLAGKPIEGLDSNKPSQKEITEARPLPQTTVEDVKAHLEDLG